ncbi:MAG: YbaB/EbfC family nucleoid-associated protein [Haliscomenobacter sp.]|nr:YbaB/EbfC family nucleoid-associated protein [Haliscomenobacter sp.]
MFGDMEAQQKAMREKLAEFIVESEAGEGAIKITANANRELTNISIDPDFLKNAEAEELEDLLLVAINRVMQRAQEKEAFETEQLLKDMLPPGMDGLFK